MAHSVVYSPEAQDDLLQLFAYLAPRAGPDIARAYVGRIEAYCMRLAHFPLRGTRRDATICGLGFG